MKQKSYWRLFASLLLTSLLLIGLVGSAIWTSQTDPKQAQNGLPRKIKAGNLAPYYAIENTFSDIDKLDLNTINVPILINVPNRTSNQMSVDEASKQKAKQLIKQLRAKNVHVILEPYPWIAGGTVGETEWDPTNHDLFFQRWKAVLEELLQDVAVPNSVSAFTVASNLVQLERDTKQWTDTISFVKNNYNGAVTYRTNWWYSAEWDTKIEQEYVAKLNNPIWSQVDFISISAYFELTDRQGTVDDITEALHESSINDRKQNIYQEIKNFHTRWNKPVFFGELGFPRRSGAASHPWNPHVSEVDNPMEQAACFAAYRKVFSQEPWLLGYSVFAIGIKETDSAFYPGEQSIEIIKGW